MIVYHATVEVGGAAFIARYFSSEVKARAWCRELCKKLHLTPKKDSFVQQCDIPAGKAGLITWLNQRYSTDASDPAIEDDGQDILEETTAE